MILPDTSTWVEFLRRQATPLQAVLEMGAEIGYTEPILMEILIGARTDEEWSRLRRLVTGASLVPFDAIADFEGAAWINRFGRSGGIALGKVDCLILSVARRTSSTLVTRDSLQARLAQRVGIDVSLTS